MGIRQFLTVSVVVAAGCTTDVQNVVPRSGELIECDLAEQNCDAGNKCVPYATEEAPLWNATMCVAEAEDPVRIGRACHAEGLMSGHDDCEAGLVCVNIHARGLQGECMPLPHDDVCEAGVQMGPVNEGAISLCVPGCNPLEQDCAQGNGCYPIAESWGCVPDASGAQGEYADECLFVNVCDPGLVCLSSAAVPGCSGGGCCSEVCDTSLGDEQCSGAEQGQTCQAWYSPGTAPAGFETVGACALPA